MHRQSHANKNIMVKHLFSFIIISLIMVACGTKDTQESCKYQATTQAMVEQVYTETQANMPHITVPTFPKLTRSIVEFGAKPDGSTLNTEAFQQAINAVSEAGGGTVIIPEGVWMTGPIELKSNVRLYADKSSLVVFSSDYTLYPIIETSFEGLDTRRCTSPIWAKGAKNIAITGHGVFNGSGQDWRPLKRSKVTASQWKAKVAAGGVLSDDEKTWYPTEEAKYAHTLCEDQNVPSLVSSEEEWNKIHSFLRPVMLSFVNCDGVLLEGVTFENSPAWNIHPLMSENIILNNLTVRNPWYSQNGDGVDIESCKNTVIMNCSFDVGDDAICMKSGKNEDGRRRAIPTENVIVNNCVVYHGHGGFVVGSEMSGDVRNIHVENCTFIGTDVGLRFKSTRGRGGVVENITIKRIYMKDIPTDPLLFYLFYGGKAAGEESEEEILARMQANIPPVTEETPQFQNITIENVICAGAKRAMFFNGLPEMKVKNVSLKDVYVSATYGAEFNQTDGLSMINTTIINEVGAPVVMRMVDNVTMENVVDKDGNLIQL